MSEVEAIGDAAPAALVGRAAEASAGEAAADAVPDACLNCGTELIGDHCHNCGQSGHVHRTFGAFWHDLLHGVLHFEGKIWRTLPLLVWRPGDLTRRYIDGQRARFVSPIALFLFSVFLMFAVVSALGGPLEFANTDDPQTRARVEREYQNARSDMVAEIATLRKQREALVASGQSTSEVDEEIREARIRLELQEGVFGTTGRSGRADVQVEGAPLDLGWFDAAYKKAKENPSLLLYKLQTNAYKFSWALIPISLPLVWLLFLHRARYRRRFGAYDHIVFVTYSLAFMTLGFVLLTVLRPLGLGDFGDVLTVVVPPVHMYRQLRGAYELSRWSAAWRTVALLAFALVAGLLFLALLLMLGVFG